MTPENFCYWFQGWLELERPETITPEQVQEIKNHLDLVFNKVTPDMRMYKIEHISTPYGVMNKNSDAFVSPTNTKKTDKIEFYPTACEDGSPGTRIDTGVLELLKNMPIVDHAHVNKNNQLSSIDNCVYYHPELKTVVDDNMFKVNNDVQYGQFYPPGFNGPSSWDFVKSDGPPMSC